MEIRRAAVAGMVGVALVVGGGGCGKVAEKAAEKAVERSSDCEDVDIDRDGGFSGTCAGDELDLDIKGGASLPTGWPAELAPPAGTSIVAATGDATGLSITGGVDGDLTAVADGITAQLEGAGYVIDDATTTDQDGTRSASIRATGEEHQAFVVLTDTTNAVEGDLTLVYQLRPVPPG